MEFTTHLQKLDSNIWGYHIVVPDLVVQYFSKKKDRRVVCTINDQETFQCAIMPKGDGTFFILINKELRKKLDLGVGAEVKAKLVEDKSKYGLPMPEELEELLAIDDEGNYFFHLLTPGKQRSLIFLAGKPKRSDTRLRKALVIVDYLKFTKGKLDFRELHQAFKEGKDHFS